LDQRTLANLTGYDVYVDAIEHILTPIQTGRAFPDLAAQGENVIIFDGGRSGTVAGTSCSSPIVASTIALLNAELIAAGKAPVGFLNPFIYSNPTLFSDITSGSNPGCGTQGFPVR